MRPLQNLKLVYNVSFGMMFYLAINSVLSVSPFMESTLTRQIELVILTCASIYIYSKIQNLDRITYEELHRRLLRNFISQTACDPPNIWDRVSSTLNKCAKSSAHNILVTHSTWTPEHSHYHTDRLFPELAKEKFDKRFAYIISIGNIGFLNSDLWRAPAMNEKIDFLEKSVELEFIPTEEVMKFTFSEDGLEKRLTELLLFVETYRNMTEVLHQTQDYVLKQLDSKGLRPTPGVTGTLLDLCSTALMRESHKPSLEQLHGLAVSHSHNALPDAPVHGVVKLLENYSNSSESEKLPQ